MASAARRSAAPACARSAVTSAVRRPVSFSADAVVSAGLPLACNTTSAPATARARAIAAPRPREAPVTRATLPSSLNKSAMARLGTAGRAGRGQEVLTNRRENIDQDDFLVEHRGAVPKVAWKVQDVACL